MNKQKYFTLSIILVTFLFFSAFLVFAWQEPTTNPPGGNVYAPINTGPSSQYKTGKLGASTNGIDPNYGLTVGSSGIKVTGNSYFEGNITATGRICDQNGCIGGGGGGGITGSGSSGQITFWTGTSTVSGDNNLFWDNTNKRLGIGTNSPSYALDINGALRLRPLTSAPSGSNGAIYYSSSENKFKCYQNGAWVDCIGGGVSSFSVSVRNSSNTEQFLINSSDNRIQFASGSGLGLEFDSTNHRVTFSLNTAAISSCTDANTQKIIWDSTNGRLTCATDQTGTGGGYWTLSGSNLYPNNNTWNVGIGTTSPQTKLEVSNTSDEILRITRSGASYPAKFKLGTDSALVLNVGNVDLLTLKGGNVGIGTTAPDYKFTVAGPIYTTELGGFRIGISGDSPEYGIRFNTTTTGGWARELSFSHLGSKVGSIGMYGSASTPTYLYFNANQQGAATGHASPHMVITPSGNVGIGTTAPSYKLHVQGGDIYSSGYVRGATGLCIGSDCRTSWPSGGVSGSGTTNYIPIWTGTTSLGNSVIYQSGSNVGIGTTSPSYKLHVNGDVGATAFYYTSDISLKENIKPLENGLDKILRLQGVSFDWKDTKEPSIGLIAQEVEKIFPELVSTDNEGLKWIDYSRLTVPLIEAIKEQQKQIDELKREIEEIKAKLQEK